MQSYYVVSGQIPLYDSVLFFVSNNQAMSIVKSYKE